MLRRVESVCYLRHLLNNYHLTRLFLFQLLGYYYHLTRLFIVTRILYHLTCFFLCVSFFQFKQLLNCLLILSLAQLNFECTRLSQPNCLLFCLFAFCSQLLQSHIFSHYSLFMPLYAYQPQAIMLIKYSHSRTRRMYQLLQLTVALMALNNNMLSTIKKIRCQGIHYGRHKGRAQ